MYRPHPSKISKNVFEIGVKAAHQIGNHTGISMSLYESSYMYENIRFTLSTRNLKKKKVK